MTNPTRTRESNPDANVRSRAMGPWSYCAALLFVLAVGTATLTPADAGQGPTEFSNFDFIGGATTIGQGSDVLLGKYWILQVTIAEETAFRALCKLSNPCSFLEGETLSANGHFTFDASGGNVIFITSAHIILG